MSAAVKPEVAKAPAAGSQTALTKRQRLLLEHTQLVTDRQSILTLWRDLNKYLFPARGRFLVTDHTKLDRRSRDSIDGVAMRAARTCAAGIATGVTNAAREWFRLSTTDPDLAEYPAVKAWLHLVTERMRGVLLGSNFYKSMHVMYGDMTGYGTCPVLIEEDSRSVIRCYPFPVGSYCVANDASQRVNYFSREWRMTTRQLVELYGLENVSETVKSQWEHGQTQSWHNVVHIVYPNPDHDASKIGGRFMAFASCTFEKAGTGDQFLRESGYEEFPIMVGRWETTAEDAYATDCPGITALGDIKQLQHGAKRGLQALDKMVSPSLVAPAGMANQVVTQLPGGVNYTDDPSGRGLRPLHEVDPKLRDLEYYQAQTREAIREAFYADLFRMSSYLDEAAGSGQAKTAAEIHERSEEKLLQLGPMLHNLDDDVYNPSIDRIFAIMLRRGMIPEAPDELQGADVRVEYLSIMHQAQKSAGLGSMERFAMYMGQLIAATEDTTIADKVDMDEALESYADMAGVPTQFVRSDDDVAAIREQRAAAQKAAQQAELAKTNAEAARNLSAADMSGDNALTALTTAARGGPSGLPNGGSL